MSAKKRPLVSVGIPTYNRPDMLDKALLSLSKQTYENIEIIVSDNASSNNETRGVIERYLKSDVRIIYYKQDETIGVLENFHFVLSKSTGKYFMWLADDDYCENNMVEVLLEKIQKNKNAVLCGCDVKVVNSDDETMRIDELKKLKGEKWSVDRRNFFSCPTTNIYHVIYGLYRAEILKNTVMEFKKGWRGAFTGLEIPFLARISLQGEILRVSEPLKIYRSHEDSIYIHESSRNTRYIDYRVRHDIRVRLLNILLQSSLPIYDKVYLTISLFYSEFKDIVKFLLVYK